MAEATSVSLNIKKALTNALFKQDDLVKEVGLQAGKAVGKDLLKKFYKGRSEAIATRMRKNGYVFEQKDTTQMIRDTLFRVIRQIVPSGDATDLVRDILDDECVATLTPKVKTDMSLESLVVLVADWTVEKVF